MLLRLFGIAACLFGLAYVVLGAMAAHLFTLDADGLRRLSLALDFLIVHAFALLFVRLPSKPNKHEFTPKLHPAQAIAGIGFLFGSLFFSGSLIAAALTGVPYWLKIVPLGGALLIVSWLWWAIVFWRSN